MAEVNLVLGWTYKVIKSDESSIIFKFTGGVVEKGIVNGEEIELTTILSGQIKSIEFVSK